MLAWMWLAKAEPRWRMSWYVAIYVETHVLVKLFCWICPALFCQGFLHVTPAVPVEQIHSKKMRAVFISSRANVNLNLNECYSFQWGQRIGARRVALDPASNFTNTVSIPTKTQLLSFWTQPKYAPQIGKKQSSWENFSTSHTLRCTIRKNLSNVHLLLVILFLDSTHLYSEDLLHFGRKRFLHILLDSAQQKRFQLFVKTRVAWVPAFTVFLLKQLPRVKP